MEGLTSEHFVHPMDRRAMRTIDLWLARHEKVAARIEAMTATYVEEAMLLNLADNTRLDGAQFAGLHKVVREAAEHLGMEMPTVFLDTDPIPNAFAVGHDDAGTILFSSGLVDAFAATELKAVAGHELGHVLARHTFFRAAVGEGFGPIAMLLSAIPGGGVLALGFQWLLHDWFRKSELTADRAALIATGDVDAVRTTILRLAGGTARVDFGEVSQEAFLRQAHEFRELMVARQEEMTLKGKIEAIAGRLMAEGQHRSHPWPALRYLEITEWAESEQFHAICEGDLPRACDVGTRSMDETPTRANAVADQELGTALKDLGETATASLGAAWKRLNSRP